MKHKIDAIQVAVIENLDNHVFSKIINGSGFNVENLDIDDEYICINVSYHCMAENGMYDGYEYFKIIYPVIDDMILDLPSIEPTHKNECILFDDEENEVKNTYYDMNSDYYFDTITHLINSTLFCEWSFKDGVWSNNPESDYMRLSFNLNNQNKV